MRDTLGTWSRTWCLAVALAATAAFAQERGARPAGREAPAARSASADSLAMRARLGILGGLAMQKTQFALGLSYDLLELTPALRGVVDLTVGLRTTELTLLPMVGVRLPLQLRAGLGLELYASGLVGMNVTFLRGGTGVAIPFRAAAGAHYQAMKGLAVGMELGMEVGPLVSPFAATYGAVHFGVMAAFAL